MEEPLVTVAVAAYNVEKFLAKGMEYVLKQTYRNLDIILVDDGSTDTTPELCDQLAGTDSRIRVFHKQNGGLGSARNVGIENSKGEFIYFFDVDDSIESNLIEDNVRVALEKDVDLVIFGFYARLDGTVEEERIGFKEELITSNQQLKKKYCEELLFARHGNGFAWNKFYRKSFIDKYSFRFGNQRIQQDEPFNMQLYLKLNRVYVSPKSYYHYVIYSGGNAANKYLPNRFEIVTDVYKRFMEFYNMWNLSDKKVLDYIHHRYFSGIYHAVTSNSFHKDNPQRLKEKHDTITRILNSSDARQCLDYLGSSGKKDPIVFCIKHRLVWALMLIYQLKQFVKTIF